MDGVHDEDPDYTGVTRSFSLDENADGSGTAITLTSTLAGIYDDGEYSTGTTLTYVESLSNDADFAIDSTTGVITYTGTGIDFETTSSVTLNYTVNDSNGGSKTDYVVIDITDLKPTAATGTGTTSTSPAGPVTVTTTNHYGQIYDVNMTEGISSSDDTGLTYQVTSQAASDGTHFGIKSDGSLYLKCLPDEGTTYSNPYLVTVEATETGGTGTHTQDFYIDLV